MNIETVKLQGENYLVNGTLSVPKAEGNRHYKLVQEWIEEGNTPEPEFTEAEIAEQEQNKINSEARAYLASTDWYITREQETGVVVPEEIKTARAEARASVVE